MIVLALLGLAAMWVAVLAPEWWRDRNQRSSRKSSSIDAFHRQLDILGRAAPRSVEPAHTLDRAQGAAWELSTTRTGDGGPALRGIPRSVDEASRRRRVVLLGLIGMAALTLVLWMATMSTAVLLIHLAVDALTLAFGLLVRRHRQLQAERMAKVRYLPAMSSSEQRFEPALVRSVR